MFCLIKRLLLGSLLFVFSLGIAFAVTVHPVQKQSWLPLHPNTAFPYSTNVSGPIGFPMALAHGSEPYMAYMTSSDKLSVICFHGDAWEKVGHSIAVAKSNPFFIDSIAMNPTAKHPVPYVLFESNTTMLGGAIQVKEFKDGKWKNAGSGVISTQGNISPDSLAVGPHGSPYVVYQAPSITNGAKNLVLKLVNGAWKQVGNKIPAPISSSMPTMFHINVSAYTGKPYISFVNGTALTVDTLVHGKWLSITNKPLTVSSWNTDYYSDFDVAIGPNDAIYASFVGSSNGSGTNGYYCTPWVYKVVNGKWKAVGDFKWYMMANGESLAISKTGVPYFAFSASKATLSHGKPTGMGPHYGYVMRYVNGQWMPLGNASGNNRNGQYHVLKLGKNNVPFLAYGNHAVTPALHVLASVI